MRRIILSPHLNSSVFSAHPGFPIFSGGFSIEKQICINGETEGGGGGDTWRVLFLSEEEEEEVWIEWVSLSFSRSFQTVWKAAQESQGCHFV